MNNILKSFDMLFKQFCSRTNTTNIPALTGTVTIKQVGLLHLDAHVFGDKLAHVDRAEAVHEEEAKARNTSVRPFKQEERSLHVPPTPICSGLVKDIHGYMASRANDPRDGCVMSLERLQIHRRNVLFGWVEREALDRRGVS